MNLHESWECFTNLINHEVKRNIQVRTLAFLTIISIHTKSNYLKRTAVAVKVPCEFGKTLYITIAFFVFIF